MRSLFFGVLMMSLFGSVSGVAAAASVQSKDLLQCRVTTIPRPARVLGAWEEWGLSPLIQITVRSDGGRLAVLLGEEEIAVPIGGGDHGLKVMNCIFKSAGGLICDLERGGAFAQVFETWGTLKKGHSFPGEYVRHQDLGKTQITPLRCRVVSDAI